MAGSSEERFRVYDAERSRKFQNSCLADDEREPSGGRKYTVARIKKPTLRSLVKKADSIFSEWVRRSACDKGGTVECVTCRKLMHWKGNGAQAGHFVKRQHMAVRYDPRNVHVQCVRCNKWRNGEEGEYGHYIIGLYGVEAHQELMALKRTIKKFTRADLESIIENYQQKLSTLEARIT